MLFINFNGECLQDASSGSFHSMEVISSGRTATAFSKPFTYVLYICICICIVAQ
jgi:hypothetical protein